ncbi:hypothetical protein J7E50_07675 [Pedobacter sp. ISL-68]|uniref:hypothetical protein n=1 Tax=unclassified Pedobacter TaxID=2628915 RepID=UPI001BE99657|nr:MULTISPECIES: hypothetical protein [unclassified Pedobacter]MBT2560710.1 hypothetical protein [Pedobacter sp. ISL-64]MBT2590089.1 hypothetical protein [Pedobacter sp. ISL-68]
MMQETIIWYNGEIFEGRIIFGFGIVLVISAMLFHFYGNTPGARALLFPILVTGVLFFAIGAGMNFSNLVKVKKAEKIYNQDRSLFLKSEIERVEGFQFMYPLSIAICLGCFLVASGLLYFTKNINFHAIAISLIVLGAVLSLIDYFSKERANIYYGSLLMKSK